MVEGSAVAAGRVGKTPDIFELWLYDNRENIP